MGNDRIDYDINVRLHVILLLGSIAISAGWTWLAFHEGPLPMRLVLLDWMPFELRLSFFLAIAAAFGLGGLLILLSLHRGPRVSIGDEGIAVRRLGRTFMGHWNDLERVERRWAPTRVALRFHSISPGEKRGTLLLTAPDGDLDAIAHDVRLRLRRLDLDEAAGPGRSVRSPTKQ